MVQGIICDKCGNADTKGYVLAGNIIVLSGIAVELNPHAWIEAIDLCEECSNEFVKILKGWWDEEDSD